MKKTILLILAIISFSTANAQGSDWVKLGIHTGMPLGDVSDTSSFSLGVDLKYQFLGTDNYAIGLVTGYTNYFGKDDFSDFGVIPLAGLFRFYPTRNFFIGTDLGYGFFTEVEGNDNGFYVRPEMGYHNNKWNIYGFYQRISSSTFSPASIGLGISYNIIRAN